MALALLYELAIGLKFRFGRSWLYSEVRDNLKNPKARTLLLQDLWARPSSANFTYVRFLLNSHNWFNRHLDDSRSFIQYTMLWWSQRYSARRWYQYLTGRSFILCFAFATLYPVIFFLLRFALNGNIELVEVNMASPPPLGRWLLLLTIIVSVISLLLIQHAPLHKKLISILNHRMTYGNIERILLIFSVIISIPSLYYYGVVLRISDIAFALIFTSTFAFFCTANLGFTVTLLTAYIFAFIFVLVFAVILDLPTILVAYDYNINLPLGLFLALAFVVSFSIIIATLVLIEKIYDSKDIFIRGVKFFVWSCTIILLLITYIHLYFIPICTNEISTACFTSETIISSLSTFLLLAIALPPINALLDWLSLALSRFCFDKVLFSARWKQWFYIALDLIGAIAILFLLYTLIFWVLERFELLFPDRVGDVTAMRQLWARSPWHPEVLWITIMGATTMLMTLLHIFTSLWGLFFWLPKDIEQKYSYANKLILEARQIPIQGSEIHPSGELHHQIAYFLTIGRDRTIVWGFCIGGAMLSWIINLFYPHIPFLSV